MNILALMVFSQGAKIELPSCLAPSPFRVGNVSVEQHGPYGPQDHSAASDQPLSSELVSAGPQSFVQENEKIIFEGAMLAWVGSALLHGAAPAAAAGVHALALVGAAVGPWMKPAYWGVLAVAAALGSGTALIGTNPCLTEWLEHERERTFDKVFGNSKIKMAFTFATNIPFTVFKVGFKLASLEAAGVLHKEKAIGCDAIKPNILSLGYSLKTDILISMCQLPEECCTKYTKFHSRDVQGNIILDDETRVKFSKLLETYDTRNVFSAVETSVETNVNNWKSHLVSSCSLGVQGVFNDRAWQAKYDHRVNVMFKLAELQSFLYDLNNLNNGNTALDSICEQDDMKEGDVCGLGYACYNALLAKGSTTNQRIAVVTTGVAIGVASFLMLDWLIVECATGPLCQGFGAGLAAMYKLTPQPNTESVAGFVAGGAIHSSLTQRSLTCVPFRCVLEEGKCSLGDNSRGMLAPGTKCVPPDHKEGAGTLLAEFAMKGLEVPLEKLRKRVQEKEGQQQVNYCTTVMCVDEDFKNPQTVLGEERNCDLPPLPDDATELLHNQEEDILKNIRESYRKWESLQSEEGRRLWALYREIRKKQQENPLTT